MAPTMAPRGTPTAYALLAAQNDFENWALPAHDYAGNRYVRSWEIGPRSVGRLRRAWVFHIPDDTMIETAPIEWNETVYVTSGHDDVYALDAATGTPRWVYQRHLQRFVGIVANRGVAVVDGRVYLGTLDGHLIALDAYSGRLLWDVQGAHDPTNSFYSMAPVAYKNLILIAPSNGDWGGVGYVSAFDAKSGRRVWEWRSIPRPGEPGSETWSGDSAKHGGGSVWGGLTIDPTTETLYVDTGNPQPDLLGSGRTGTNLYTDSIVALDIRGPKPKLKWYYQLIPHDMHDWDPAMAPVLFEGRVGGAERRLVATADKGGNFWVFDATSGKLVHHQLVSQQVGATSAPDAKGTRTCPATNGGVQYNGGAYLPETNAFYVPSIEQCALFLSDGSVKYVPGEMYLGGSVAGTYGETFGWMNAIDVDTGNFKWRRRLPLPAMGGALTLSSGLVFSGMLDGTFDAYDAQSGQVLWQYQTGSAIKAAPSAYALGGKEYIVVGSGKPGDNFADLPGVAGDAAGSMISAFSF